MTNYWYVARTNEILLDIDRPNSALKHSEERLRGAMSSRQLHINRIEYHASLNANHLHGLITLDQDLHPIERSVWGIVFHGDIYRGCNNIMRALYEVPSPDLLITPIRFEREPDRICNCTCKHTAPVMDACEAADALRGVDRIRSFFGKPEAGEEIFRYDYVAHRENFIWPSNETISRIR
jgi:hypothetical protein